MGFLSGLANIAGPIANIAGPALGLLGASRGARNSANPSQATAPYLQRAAQYGQQAYNPFIQEGQQTGNQLFPTQDQMAQNPVDYYNQLMSQYQPSQGYQYRESQLNKAAGNTAAAGGFAGTENDIANRTELINALMGQDMQQFLQNVLGIQGAGLQGQEERVNRGFGASHGLANYMGEVSGAQAGNAYAGQANRNQGRAGVYSALSGLIGPVGNALGNMSSSMSPSQGPTMGGYGGQSWANAQRSGINNIVGGTPWR